MPKQQTIKFEIPVVQTVPVALNVGGHYSITRGAGTARRTIRGVVLAEYDGSIIVKTKSGHLHDIAIDTIAEVADGE